MLVQLIGGFALGGERCKPTPHCPLEMFTLERRQEIFKVPSNSRDVRFAITYRVKNELERHNSHYHHMRLGHKKKCENLPLL